MANNRAAVGTANHINVDSALRKLVRDSRSGFEIQIILRYYTPTDWDWVAIRYPEGNANIRVPSEQLKRFHGMTWPQIIEWLTGYLAQHPDDGFWTV
jgi:hypothetical protein